MPRLYKAHQRIFGEDAPVEDFGVIGSYNVENEGVRLVENTKGIKKMQKLDNYLQGMFKMTHVKDFTRLIPSEDLNSLFYMLTYQRAYGQQVGIPEWDEDTQYYVNASWVQYDGSVYKAIKGYDGADENINKVPTDREYWSRPFNLVEVLGEIARIKQAGILQWDSNRQYMYGDAVHYDGHIFTSRSDINRGRQPAGVFSDYWLDITNFMDVENEIKEIVRLGAFPVGFLYIQFPGCVDPVTLNIPGRWANISSRYNGNFIRFEHPSYTSSFSGSAYQSDRDSKHLEYVRSSVLSTPAADPPLSADFQKYRASGQFYTYYVSQTLGYMNPDFGYPLGSTMALIEITQGRWYNNPQDYNFDAVEGQYFAAAAAETSRLRDLDRVQRESSAAAARAASAQQDRTRAEEARAASIAQKERLEVQLGSVVTGLTDAEQAKAEAERIAKEKDRAAADAKDRADKINELANTAGESVTEAAERVEETKAEADAKQERLIEGAEAIFDSYTSNPIKQATIGAVYPLLRDISNQYKENPDIFRENPELLEEYVMHTMRQPFSAASSSVFPDIVQERDELRAEQEAQEETLRIQEDFLKTQVEEADKAQEKADQVKAEANQAKTEAATAAELAEQKRQEKEAAEAALASPEFTQSLEDAQTALVDAIIEEEEASVDVEEKESEKASLASDTTTLSAREELNLKVETLRAIPLEERGGGIQYYVPPVQVRLNHQHRNGLWYNFPESVNVNFGLRFRLSTARAYPRNYAVRLWERIE